MVTSGILGSDADIVRAQVERAISEMRASRPVVVRRGDRAVIAFGVDGIDIASAEAAAALGTAMPHLLLPAARLRRLGLERTQPARVALPQIAAARIEALALTIESRIDAPVSPVDDIDEAALELARLALVVPAVVMVPVPADAVPAHLLSVDVDGVMAYRRLEAKAIRIVGRAPVPLEGAPETEFVVFRGGEGLRDQVAIVIGKVDPAKPVPVRLHSACLTGDLFGSLKCDCGDQLRDTVQWMARNGAGILLYLDQEGRGNGIANKMRAYRLQSQGWDTYDADEVLGFDLDQRRFDFAAEMLKQLGIRSIDVMTNNPIKIAAMTEAGIEVHAERRVIGRATDENVRYLTSKRDRAGHAIDADALLASLTARK
ncbi:GTP cyclohydrolase II RibA [Phreatobacter oligotrophus]|jgi:GTP cyclohydrolase II|uniref:GTP cyclohydrolase II RibA n=1 Tax=Phreatobacter oligotrophus TaxID=1122261 RepID=UPI002353288F|nr:GTP cyclohydrolase II RibA [Phreatobacter oligotrophus]MBX9989876.1 GTP cyclohydrolase II RibA [Phreatobacter oligotrophus]